MVQLTMKMCRWNQGSLLELRSLELMIENEKHYCICWVNGGEHVFLS